MNAVRAGSVAPLQRDALRTDALILARRGLTLGAIAQQLGVSTSTVHRWLQ
ncbi:helix-turn-helix domain-containing protein [Naumannella sp. ID2617S]|nr:helix-turn-helix domain-containing protein [Naumannella sp. ID2617S]